ncbi:MAG: hypothetical protein OEW29_04805 [Acidimicrobiia bacterium]|nr:hypothetical protein [Acidimicrobiia bacterium]
MSLSSWEERILDRLGAASRVREIENELKRAGGLTTPIDRTKARVSRPHRPSAPDDR